MSTTALFSGSRCYFFSGNEYIRVTRGDTGPGTIDPNYPRNISAWNFPGTFGQNGIDAALHSGSKTYFFSGDQYIRVTRGDTGSGTLDPNYPRNISAWNWPNAFETSWSEIGGNFAFDRAITTAQRTTLLQQQRRAFGQIQACGSLTNAQRTALTDTYRRPIRHGINTTPNVNASAFLNRNQVFVNFGVLFPQGNDEIAQTLIHEMMHCAGFTHPGRTTADAPGDGGPYYGTPPLQAELCIAGVQSDVVCVDGPDGCSIENRRP